MSDPPRLLDRRQEQTRDEIARAAIDLFAERGYDETSMADVAEHAGVSRRTVYRYFPAKDDLVFEHPRRWHERFQLEAAARTPEESGRDACLRALRAVTVLIDDHADEVREAFAVNMSTPTLIGRHGRSDRAWSQAVLDLLISDTDGTPEDWTRTVTFAFALTGATNGLIASWASQEPGTSMATMLEELIPRLDSLWP